MARVDRLLSLVVDQGANELRLGTDVAPRMLASGTPKKLSIPVTPEPILRDLLDEILSPERDAELAARRRVELDYEAAGTGAFHVKLLPRDGGGFDVVFVRVAAVATRTAPPIPTAAAVATRPPPTATPAPTAANVLPPAAREAPAAGVAASSTGHADATTSEPLTAMATPELAHVLAHGAARGASDVHLADGESPSVRVDGAMLHIDEIGSIDVASLLALAPSALARLARGLAVDLGIDVPGVGRVRAHVFRTAAGLAAAVRLMPPETPSINALHLPLPIHDLAEQPHGLVLVCGPAGSGKSTTIAALAQHALSRRSIVLVTLEDPIEYRLTAARTSVLRRRQVGRDVPGFVAGLRDALREDLDVLLVGELRDAETIQLAVTAAETGHLVLASLHSRSVAATVARIVDAYPAAQQEHVRSQLADSLRGVVCQRLLPRAGGEGRVPAVEILRMTPGVAALVREGRPEQLASAMQAGRREGMIQLERSLADLVAAGTIDLKTAKAAANDPASLTMYLTK